MSLPEKNTFADTEMALKFLSVEPQLTQWRTELALAETARQTRDNTLSRYERGDATKEEVDAAKERVAKAWNKQKATRTAATERLRSLGLLDFLPGLENPPTWPGESEMLSKDDAEAGASSTGTARPAQ